MTTRSHRLLHTLALMASGTAGSILLAICQSVLVARLLGPAALAWYATVTVGVLVAAQLSDCGLANAFAFFGRERPEALRSLMRLLIRHVAGCIVLAALVVALAMGLAVPAAREILSSRAFSVVVVALFGSGLAATVLPVLVLAAGRYRAYVAFANASIALQLACIVAAYGIAGASWRAFVVAVAAAQTVMVAVQLSYVARRFPRGTPGAVTAGECYGYGFRIKWAEVMKLLSGRVDLLVVAAALPARDVGVYSLALGLREFGMTPLRTYAGLLQNLLVDRRREGLDDRTLVIGSLILQALVSVAVAAGAFVLFPIALPIVYGEAYAPAATPAAIAISSTIFLSLAGLCWTVFNMRGRPGLTSVIVTVSGLAGPPLVYALARRYGITGAAVASVLTAAVSAVLSLAALAVIRGYRARDVAFAARRLGVLVRGLKRTAPPAAPDSQAVV